MTQQSDIAATVHNGVHDERNVVSSLLERDNSLARKGCRAVVTTEQMLTSLRTQCAGWGQSMWVAYHTQRTVTTLQGICRLTLCVRWCRNPQCEWYHRPYRPEEEGRTSPERYLAALEEKLIKERLPS